MGQVVVVAPDSEKSSVGHAITLIDPLRVWEFEKNGKLFGYAVSGTPADCVKIAYWALLDETPDLIVSGINLGSNTGINVIYSGTASAAAEGALLGIPSFAISLTTKNDPDYTFAAKFARRLSRIILKRGLPKGTFLNVNVPVGKAGEIKGIAVTKQGQANYKEKYDRRIDPQNRVYYWLTGHKVNVEEEDNDVDDRAVIDNKISITPIHYDLTNYNFMDELKHWFAKK